MAEDWPEYDLLGDYAADGGGAETVLDADFFEAAAPSSGDAVRTDLLSEDSSPGHGTGGFTTGSFTPPDDSLLVALVSVMEDSGSSDPSGDLTITDSVGLTWTSRVAVGNASPWAIGQRVWTAPVTTGVSMTVTFDAGARNIYVYFCNIVAYAGSAGVGTSGSLASTVTDGAETLTLAAAPASTSEIIGGIMQDCSGVGGASPGVGHTELYDIDHLDGSAAQFQVRPPGSTSTAFEWADVGVGASLIKGTAVALEILGSAGGASVSFTADGSSATSGTASFAREVAASASGTASSSGVAAFSVTRSAVGSGASASVGAAGFTVEKATAAAGSSATTGAALFVVERPATLTGSSASSGAASFSPERPFSADGLSGTSGTATFTPGLPWTGAGSSGSAGAATFGVDHPAQASGSASGAATAAFGVTHPVAAAGSSGSAGIAAALVEHSVSGAGQSGTTGAAAFGAEVSFSASGQSGSSGSGSFESFAVVEFSASGTSATPATAGFVTVRGFTAAGPCSTAGTASFDVDVAVDLDGSSNTEGLAVFGVTHELSAVGQSGSSGTMTAALASPSLVVPSTGVYPGPRRTTGYLSGDLATAGYVNVGATSGYDPVDRTTSGYPGPATTEGYQA